MKAATIALAAILALSSTAFAGSKDGKPAKPIVTPAQQEQLIDPNSTGSIKSANQDSAKTPRIGMELNPFSFGSFGSFH